MANCKDCLCVDVCKYNDKVNEWCKGTCPRFKDKSLYIKVPCNVGDTVYSIKNYHINECRVVWIRIDTRKSITILLMTKDFIFYDVSLKDFGKTVFSNHDEAKKVLNSSEKSDN